MSDSRRVRIEYTNWRGERAWRTVLPQRFFFGRTSWHMTPQWIMEARDLEKKEVRFFAMCMIHFWEPAE